MKVFSKGSFVCVFGLCLVLSGCAVMGPIGYSFYSAARSGSLPEAERMLQQGKDINETGEFGIAPIQQAVMNNDIPMAKFLLEHGANPNVRAMGSTPLVIAIRNGYTEAALLLIKHGADVNDPSSWGSQRPLIACSAYGNAIMAQALIDAGADVNYRDGKGKTPADYARDYKKIEVLAVLKKAGASVSYTGDKAKDIVTAILSGDREKVRSLLEEGAAPDTKTESGEYLLSYALAYAWPDIVELLVKKGADVNRKDKGGWTVMMTAALEGQAEMLKAFEAAGARMVYTGSKQDDLLTAVLLDDQGKVKELLSQGADVNFVYRHKATVLHYAVHKKNMAMAESLVEHGADINAKDEAGSTVLHEAIKARDVALVKYLLAKGAQADGKAVLLSEGKDPGYKGVDLPEITLLLKPEVLRRQMLRAQAAVESAQSVEDYQKAIAEYNLAKDMSPDLPDIYYNLGLVQDKAGLYADAVKSLQKYLELSPKASDAQAVRDMIYKLEYKLEQEKK